MKDGGSAFPTKGWKHPTSPPGDILPESDMSLRDWFAGMAIAGILICSENDEKLAAWAYNLANAMIAEREKEPQK